MGIVSGVFGFLRKGISIGPDDKRRLFLSVFILALVIRLIALAWCAAGWSPEQIGIRGGDSQQYLNAGAALATNFDIKTKGIIIFGPGYPALIGALHFVFGDCRIAFLIVQCFIGALSSLLLAELVLILTASPRAALIAAFINAVSPVSITMSHYFLSVNLFFPLLLLAIILFLKAMKTGKYLEFALSGVFLATATLTRSIGQFMIFAIFVFYFVFREKPVKSYRSFSGLIITVAVFVLLFFSWVVHNDRNFNFRQVSFAGPTAMFKASAQINAEITGRSYREELDTLINDLVSRENYKNDYYGTYADFASETFWGLALNHPAATAKTIGGNIIYYLNGQYGWFVLFASIIAGFYLTITGNIKIVIFAGLIYIYFAVFSGLAIIAQGPRILYPAQIGWIILIAAALDRILTSILGRYGTSGALPVRRMDSA